MEPAMKLLISSLVLGFLSITCYGVSFGTNVWWVIKTGGIKTTQGLWKACVEYNGATQCKNREDFLSFKEKKGMSASPVNGAGLFCFSQIISGCITGLLKKPFPLDAPKLQSFLPFSTAINAQGCTIITNTPKRRHVNGRLFTM